ncbi:MAG: hypothetical protein ABIH23_04925, partial [bacterium]
MTTHQPEREAALDIPLSSDPNSVPCAFCEGNESYTPPEIMAIPKDGRRQPNGKGWLIRVVPNRAPILTVEGEEEREGVGMFDRMRGVGAHEIIIESPQHEDRLTSFTKDHIQRILS